MLMEYAKRICVVNLLCLISVTAVAESKDLTLTIHPYKSSSTLNKSFSPLASYLSKACKCNVSLDISKDYQSHISKAGQDQLDIAYMGPASYVKLVNQYGNKRILSRLQIKGSATFSGYIIASSKSQIKNIEDLKGKRFAFGSRASTMSHLVPRFMLLQSGLDMKKDFSKYEFLGSHDNVALSVLTGNYDAGAVKEGVFHKYQKRGLLAVAKTPELSEHLFVVSNKLPSEQYEIIRAAMLNMHATSRGMHAMHTIKKTMTRMVPAADSDYDNLREILEKLQANNVKY